MVRGLNNNTNLIGWEVMNEPEWLIENKFVQLGDLQRFVAMIAEAVHKNSNKYITVGSASLKWNSNVNPAVANYWSD